MRRDRFLTGIFAGIIILILVSLFLYLLWQRQIDPVDEGTPSGVVRGYILAIQHQKYERAYT